jgi:phosphate transport system protein
MGSLVDTAIDRAIIALGDRDIALAREVMEGDAAINDLRFTIEEECLTLIATQQPTAGDLRTVVAAMNIVNDMERIADHAAGIAKTVVRMGDLPRKPLVDLPRMARSTRTMLKQSPMPFWPTMWRPPAPLPRKTTGDHLYKTVFDDLLGIMARD